MGVPLAWHNLWHEKSKLALHVVGITATLALIALLVGLRAGMYATLTAYVDNAGADLIVSQLGVEGLFSSNSAIPAALHDDLAASEDVLEVGHVLVADIIFTHGKTKTPVLLVGYNPETGIGGPWHIGAGRAVQNDNEITLDMWLAWRSDIAIGDEVAILGQPFTVVGLTRETASWMSPYLFISQQAAEEVMQLPGTASFYLLRVTDGADLTATAASIETRFDGVSVLTPESMAAADRKVLATVLDAPINVMLFISAVIAVSVMGIITYSNILSRIEEYSVLKAIGAGSGWLQGLVARETLYRTGFGFALGTGLSYLVADLIMRQWPQFTVIIQPETIAAVGVAALLMTLVAGLWPVRRIIGLDPASVFKA